MINARISQSDSSMSVDPKAMEGLKQSARQNSPEALKEAAKQFEALFMNMVMKSMRDASPKDGLFDNEQSKMFSSMLDQQLSQNMAKRGVGLSDMLIQQLSNNRSAQTADAASAAPSPSGMATFSQIRQPGAESSASVDSIAQPIEGISQHTRLASIVENGKPSQRALLAMAEIAQNKEGKVSTASTLNAATSSSSMQPAPTTISRLAKSEHVRAFEEKLFAHAKEASLTTGIPAKFMLGQAALESGWGKREIIAADGTTSHNVFGIKASASWKGKVVETATTEYVNGVAERKIEKFRSYDSYADAFRDYAKLLTSNPRYKNVVASSDAASFAQGLQRAGYATDPRYAEKLSRIINQTLST